MLPSVPYGNQNTETALETEQGYKSVRGQLTEGRWLTFEHNGRAISNLGNISASISTGAATRDHELKAQRWVLQQLLPGGDKFHVYSALDQRYIVAGLGLGSKSEAQNITITYSGSRGGYNLLQESGEFIAIDHAAEIIQSSNQSCGFEIYSVTYSS
jgi:phospholipase C